MLLENRYRQQGIVEDYRSTAHEAQAWLEKTFRALEEIDSGMNTGSQERANRVRHLADEFEAVSAETLSQLQEKAKAASQEVGDLDRQQVQVCQPFILSKSKTN